jgi:hypothetical protein
MNTDQSTSGCKIISITSSRPVTRTSQPAALALLRAPHVVSLAQLASSIRADRRLCYFVTQAACAAFGCASLSVEDAIVLLGIGRLRALLESHTQDGRSISRLRLGSRRNPIASAVRLRPQTISQGEPE